MPDLTGKISIVTGANSGIGYEVARNLALMGAHVVLACRDINKGEVAADNIRLQKPLGSLEIIPLDLANLASIRDFAQAFSSQHQEIHILCNNAGVMATPYRHTADGFELQVGTNHLGHFALTGSLIDLILKTTSARVITVTSSVHHLGRLKLNSFVDNRFYFRWAAYIQSKLANIMFAYELQRRFKAIGSKSMSVAVNPGYTATNLRTDDSKTARLVLESKIIGLGNRLIAMSAEQGASGLLYAAMDVGIRGGEYINPSGRLSLKGVPKISRSSRQSYDPVLAAKLWNQSVELTGVVFEALSAGDTRPGTDTVSDT